MIPFNEVSVEKLNTFFKSLGDLVGVKITYVGGFEPYLLVDDEKVSLTSGDSIQNMQLKIQEVLKRKLKEKRNK